MDIVERLRQLGKPLGRTIAGYRDRDNLKAAGALAELSFAALAAADEIERLRRENADLRPAAARQGLYVD